jgi:hypothetical protein
VRRSATEEAPTEVNITLIDKNHVTFLVSFFSFVTFVCLYAQYQNQTKIEQESIARCHQRTVLEQIVSKEVVELDNIDNHYIGKVFPEWVTARRISLDGYAKHRREFGQVQCDSIRR